MQAFFSWLTSQSGVSLLVALVALVGVLVTTGWNNKAADKRRRADLEAADKRRKEDQAAEDARRKADDDRRERERSEDRKSSVSKLEAEQNFQYEKWLMQLVVQEKARQRQAVADFFREIREAERKLDSFSREQILSSPTSFDSVNEREFKLRRAFKKEDFFVDILAAVQRLEMEITQQDVGSAVGNLAKILDKELSDFTNMRDNDREKWLEQCGSSVALGESLQYAMNSLRNAARNNLHPFHFID